MKQMLTLLLMVLGLLFVVCAMPRQKRQNLIFEYDKDTIVFNNDDDNDSSEWWLKLITPTTTSPTTTTTTTNRPSTPTPANPDDDRLCENNCLSTREYNPICATDGVAYQTYQNPSRFRCARKCGLNIQIHHNGRCTFRSS